jgi:hypothetical protein
LYNLSTVTSTNHIAATSHTVAQNVNIYMRIKSQKETPSIRRLEIMNVPPAILDSVCRKINAYPLKQLPKVS